MQETASGRSIRPPRSLPARAAAAAALAVVVNVAVVLAVEGLGVAPGFRALTVPPVALLSAVGVAGAAVVYWALRRRVERPERTFVRIAAVVLVASFVPDLALLAADDAATVPGVLVLMAMHVVVAVIAVGVLVADRPDRP